MWGQVLRWEARGGGRARTLEFVLAYIDGGGGVDYVGGEEVDHCGRCCMGIGFKEVRRMVIELGGFYMFVRRKVENNCEFAGKAQSGGWDLGSNVSIFVCCSCQMQANMFESAERVSKIYRHYPDNQVLSLTISSSTNASRRHFECVSRSINRYILFAFWYHPSPIKRLESDGTPMSLCQNGVACAVHM